MIWPITFLATASGFDDGQGAFDCHFFTLWVGFGKSLILTVRRDGPGGKKPGGAVANSAAPLRGPPWPPGEPDRPPCRRQHRSGALLTGAGWRQAPISSGCLALRACCCSSVP